MLVIIPRVQEFSADTTSELPGPRVLARSATTGYRNAEQARKQ
jgi:hypothetical protein